MSAAEAYTLGEDEQVTVPKAVVLSTEIPENLQVTVPEAYAAVKALMEDGVRYHVSFLDDDGGIFRRYSRHIPSEAWLIARPIDEQGMLPRGRAIVCSLPIGLVPHVEQGSLAESYKAELAALIAADEGSE